MFARHFCLSLRDPLPTSSLSVMRLLGLIAGRFYVLVWLTVRSDSGGRRMYRSLTVSHAWSCACCYAIYPCFINCLRSVDSSSSVFSSASSNIS